ncbi:Hint domain-containing protein [Sinisalibacter lacisalsi]|uniref:Hedgehog/Intein (Hint) domain-containing protein n=1 Tax=Sinisalibacter lacisalsi TaxID=1526570 RepID=A0ABQ1QDA5_9RHOB|nr:Hint domain-containing protein [Sinisalibacter lacisalsi]GGD21850.1 hypothetical protein GCM10011358_02920 [Sinisalibacter lacisalsi]
MSWIALTDMSRPMFNIRGIGVPSDAPGARPPPSAHEIMPTGTMMFELRLEDTGGERRRILSFERNRDWRREILVEITADGRLSMAFRQGVARSRAEIGLPPIPRDGLLRVSYSWDSPRRTARLTVEFVEDGRIFQAQAANPVPLPVGDVKALMRNGRATRADPAISYIAVSDTVEPVGFGSGIVADTPIETVEGPVPAHRLRLGDMVVTAESGSQPVRWIVKRTVPALGDFRPIRLRAPFLGLGRDMIMAPAHRVRLDLGENEYTFGENEVLVPAATLANGKHARPETRHRLVTYYQILLDVHDCLLHDGLWAESLFVGTMARRPEIISSTSLGEVPATALPLHRAQRRPALSALGIRTIAASLLEA